MFFSKERISRMSAQTEKLPLLKRLSYKQAKYVIFITFTLGFLFSIIQISLDYSNARRDFEAQSLQVLNIVKQPAAQAVYTFDSYLAEQVVQGLFAYHFIYQVSVVDEHGEPLATKKRPLAESSKRWLSEIFFGKEKVYNIPLIIENNEQFGSLLVHLDTHLIAQGFLGRTVVEVLSGFLRNFLLAGFLLLLFHTMVTRPLFHITKRLISIDPEKPEKVRLSYPEKHKEDELGVLVSTTNQLLSSIDQKIVERERINEELELRVAERTLDLQKANNEISLLNEGLRTENVRMGTELEVTRRLQQMLLPKEKELENINGLEIAGFMEPAAEVGGDYYDVLQSKGQVKIGIGDVTGHGLESGVLMVMVQTAVRTLLANNVSNPETFLSVLNSAIYDNVQRIDSDKSLSLSLLDYTDGVLRLSGQHEEMLVVRDGGKVERIDTIDLGFPIGLEADISSFISQHEIKLETGDGVVLYTDGVTEAENMDNEFYGVERLCEVVSKNWQHPALAIKDAIIDDLTRHIGEQTLYDDITLLILKKKEDLKETLVPSL